MTLASLVHGVRPNLTLLVTAAAPSALSAVFEHRGAWASFVALDQLHTELTKGTSSPLAVDAVIIEASPDSRAADAAVSAAKAANDVRALPEHCTMRTGYRWNATPLVIVVRDPNVATMMRHDHKLSGIAICDFQYGIDALYGAIAQQVRQHRDRVHAELDDAGCIVEYGPDGRFRLRGKSANYRKNGFAQVFETKLYHGPSDERRKQRSPWVIAADERAVAFDLERFEWLITGAAKCEEDLQKFLTGSAYFLDAAQFELIAKPHLDRWDGDTIIPDIVVHPYAPDGSVITPHIVELKWFDGRMVIGAKRRWEFAAPIRRGVNQARDYRESFSDERNSGEIHRIFGKPIAPPKLSVVGGMIEPSDRHKKDHAQSFVPDVEVKAYNDLLETARERFRGGLG